MTTFFLILASVYGADLATKMLVRARLPLGSEIHLAPFFSLCHVENTGVAFGLFQGRNTLFAVLGILIAAGIIWWGLQLYRTDRFASLTLAAVLGGALGNLTDRIAFGKVTDFLDFYWGQYHWPAFNIADSAICVGATLLIAHNFWTDLRSKRVDHVSAPR